MVQRVQPGRVDWINWINRRSPDGRQRIKPAGLGAVLLPASGRARLAGYAGMRTKLPTQARYGAGMSDPWDWVEGPGAGQFTGLC